MKKTLSVLLSFVMMITSMLATQIPAYADDDDIKASGTCGNTATYTFNSTTGALNITGTGSVDSDAFYYADNKSDVKSVTVAGTISEIESYAFSGFSYLETVVINGVKTISQSVFSGCTSLESLTLNEGTETIDAWAFDGCVNLEELVLPNSLKSLDGNAFYNCKGLKNVTFGTGLTIIPNYIFNQFISLETVVIPNGVKKIGDDAFSESGLTSVYIPSSVTEIGSYAFKECSFLKTVVIDGASVISGSAFSNCASLETVTINSGTKKIDSWAFSDNPSLKKITIPDTVVDIDSTALSSSPVVVVDYQGTAEQWKKIDENGYISEETVVSTETGVVGTKAIKKVALSKTAYTYNGKVNKPAVKVTDNEGYSVSNEYYKVTYPKGMKNVGVYKVKVTFRGVHEGTPAKTLSYKINPKGTTLGTVTAKKKSVVVTWKKQATQTTGYEIQYGTAKNFKGAKTAKVTKNKTTKLTLKKLSSKKKYYFRIRTYKTVNGKKYYSSWTKAKNIKVK